MGQRSSGAVGLLALACVLASGGATAQDTLSVASYGGVYQEALRKAFYDPTEKILGLKIKEHTLTSIVDIRKQVQANAVEWDIAELYSGQCQQAAHEGLIEPLDYKVITNTKGIPHELVKPHWVGFTAFSTVLAWNKNVYKTPPQNWADFWDTKKFPGSRALSGYGLQGNAEIALLADGVTPDRIYPLDMDRAIKKLEAIKPSVVTWWTSGAQATQLAKSQQADMLSIWVARIEDAVKQGAPYEFTYDQALMDIECLVVPKGARHKELAMKAINSFLDPSLQADILKYVSYGPVNQQAYETGKVSKEMIERSNTSPENYKKQVMHNKEHWTEHHHKFVERWDQFFQKTK
ncbi:MAG TPA: ABC transporter substrate-binding protein [Microvirga sp.]|jgi:putative spermidine/putrescine transport system substrate-binding protein|nr:ABC transporter substrate-binding protein [Microvirga sp.]